MSKERDDVKASEGMEDRRKAKEQKQEQETRECVLGPKVEGKERML